MMLEHVNYFSKQHSELYFCWRVVVTLFLIRELVTNEDVYEDINQYTILILWVSNVTHYFALSSATTSRPRSGRAGGTPISIGTLRVTVIGLIYGNHWVCFWNCTDNGHLGLIKTDLDLEAKTHGVKEVALFMPIFWEHYPFLLQFNTYYWFPAQKLPWCQDNVRAKIGLISAVCW